MNENLLLVEGPAAKRFPSLGQFRYIALNVDQETPKDHFLWSLLCLSYFNPCCLGLAALIHSVKARDRKVMGDIEGARSYGSTARTLNIISTVLFCLFVFLSVIIIAVVSDKIINTVQSLQG